MVGRHFPSFVGGCQMSTLPLILKLFVETALFEFYPKVADKPQIRPATQMGRLSYFALSLSLKGDRIA